MPPLRRPAVLLAVAAGVVGLGACDRPATPPAAPLGPRADFVVAAGDSSYWVTQGPAGVRVRASPLFLARWGGRLAEVYVVDDEHAFDDGAWFAAQRVYRRDLLTGDSTLIFADPAVPRRAARHAAAHPDARLLDPGEQADPPDAPDADGPEDGRPEDAPAAPNAEATVALAAAHGPYLTFDQRTTVDGGGSQGAAGPVGAVGGAAFDAADVGSWDVARRRVVDLRTGRAASLGALFGDGAARLVTDAGRRALRAAVDSLRPGARRALRDARAAARAALARGAAPVTAPDADPEENDDPRAAIDAARRAAAALGTLRLDPDNFGLAVRAGAPAVAFVALGRDRDGTAVTLPLPPIVVPGPAPVWWRAEVAPTLFVGPGADAVPNDGASASGLPHDVPSGDAAVGGRSDAPRPEGGTLHARTARWRAAGGTYEVRARVAAGTAALELVPTGAPAAGAPAAGAASVARRVWPLGRVPAPLAQLFPVDDPATHRALRRAFDESAFYDDATTSVAWRPSPPAAHTAGRARWARFARPAR